MVACPSAASPIFSKSKNFLFWKDSTLFLLLVALKRAVGFPSSTHTSERIHEGGANGFHPLGRFPLPQTVRNGMKVWPPVARSILHVVPQERDGWECRPAHRAFVVRENHICPVTHRVLVTVPVVGARRTDVPEALVAVSNENTVCQLKSCHALLFLKWWLNVFSSAT